LAAAPAWGGPTAVRVEPVVPAAALSAAAPAAFAASRALGPVALSAPAGLGASALLAPSAIPAALSAPAPAPEPDAAAAPPAAREALASVAAQAASADAVAAAPGSLQAGAALDAAFAGVPTRDASVDGKPSGLTAWVHSLRGIETPPIGYLGYGKSAVVLSLRLPTGDLVAVKIGKWRSYTREYQAMLEEPFRLEQAYREYSARPVPGFSVLRPRRDVSFDAVQLAALRRAAIQAGVPKAAARETVRVPVVTDMAPGWTLHDFQEAGGSVSAADRAVLDAGLARLNELGWAVKDLAPKNIVIARGQDGRLSFTLIDGGSLTWERPGSPALASAIRTQQSYRATLFP
jgi:hypothetical protein